MPKYYATIPLCGSMEFYGIEADSPKDVFEACLNKLWRLKIVDDDGEEIHDIEFGELELLERVSEGNVLNAPCHEIDIALEGDQD